MTFANGEAPTPQIAAQMNLEPYNLVSYESSICCELSIVTGRHTELKNIVEQIILICG